MDISYLKDLKRTVLISVDRSNSTYKSTKLYSYVNIASGSSYLRTYRNYDIEYATNLEEITNLLITGGTGFIGSNLVKVLKSTGKYDITVIDNLRSPSSDLSYKENNVSYIISLFYLYQI